MIHLNIGSNLNSSFGSKFDNINIATNLLKDSKIKIVKNFKFLSNTFVSKYDFSKISKYWYI